MKLLESLLADTSALAKQITLRPGVEAELKTSFFKLVMQLDALARRRKDVINSLASLRRSSKSLSSVALACNKAMDVSLVVEWKENVRESFLLVSIVCQIVADEVEI